MTSIKYKLENLFEEIFQKYLTEKEELLLLDLKSNQEFVQQFIFKQE
jgi:hypothetical protein